MLAIETKGLRKLYGNRVALEGLTLRVSQGEVFGFLGPNGAGKTTAVKIITGLVAASGGEARIFGRSPGDPLARQRIGFLPEHFRFQDWLTGAELLEFHGRLCGMNRAARQSRTATVLSLVGLEHRADQRIRSYSKGMQQRLGIAQALLGRPDVVLLDEPTSALDPLGRKEVRDLLRRLRGEGVTVFLNSHLLSEVEQVCDRVAIIERGRVVREGPMSEMLSGYNQLHIVLDRIDTEVSSILASYGAVRLVDGRALVLEVTDIEVAPDVARVLMERGYELHQLTPIQRSLEDIFAEVVKGDGL